MSILKKVLSLFFSKEQKPVVVDTLEPPPELGAETAEQSAEPERITPEMDSRVLKNDRPFCIDCGRQMLHNGRGFQPTQLGINVEYSLYFCANCGKTAITIARIKVNYTTNKKPEMVFDVFWGHPVERREVNERLEKLSDTMAYIDKIAQEKAYTTSS